MAELASDDDADLMQLFDELQAMHSEGQDLPDWFMASGSPMAISRRTTSVVVPCGQQQHQPAGSRVETRDSLVRSRIDNTAPVDQLVATL